MFRHRQWRQPRVRMMSNSLAKACVCRAGAWAGVPATSPLTAPVLRLRPFHLLPCRLRAGARPLHSSARLDAKILASDPIDPICGAVLVSGVRVGPAGQELARLGVRSAGRVCSPSLTPPHSHRAAQKERGHELVEANRMSIPVAELLKMIPDFDGLIVRR